jgi:hypothetical protein
MKKHRPTRRVRGSFLFLAAYSFISIFFCGEPVSGAIFFYLFLLCDFPRHSIFFMVENQFNTNAGERMKKFHQLQCTRKFATYLYSFFFTVAIKGRV